MLITRPLARFVRMLGFVLSVAALTAACSGEEDAPADADAAGGGEQARVILAGALVEPPYEVAVDGAEVTLNGALIASFAAPPAPEPEAVDESATLDILSLVELARLAYHDAGGGDEGLDAALDAVEARAEVSAASITETDGYARLDVTDTNGATAAFIPQTPDAEVRQPSDAERVEAAQEYATSVEEHLADGGGLIASASMLMLVPAEAIADLLAETDAAVRLGGDQSRDALLALYDDETTVDEIIERYEPRATSARLLPSRFLDAALGAPAQPIALRGAAPAGAAVAFQATEPSKTPGSKKAWILQTLYATDQQGFIDALVLEGYEVRSFNFYNQAQPAGSGWGAFLKTSRSGAAYFATHSSDTGLSIQSFARRADANTAAGHLATQIAAGDLGWWQEADGTWWLKVTPQGIRGNWQSDNTIVHSASCHSITLAGAFNAREFFGYEPTTSCAIAGPDTTRLWKRLSGIDGDGSLREASVAVGAGGFSGGFRYRDGSRGEGTVIAPAVVATQPVEPIVVGGQGFVLVQFDADMATSSPPTAVLEITGCLRPIDQGQWQFASTLTLGVEATAVGEAQVRVRTASAQADRGRQHLNGNQSPEGKNAVAPNRDDYLFTVQCIASGIATPTPTPTTGVQPPPDPTPAGTPVTGVGPFGETFWVRVPADSTVPEGFVRVEVLVFNGEHYPVSQFVVAVPDNCTEDHYHSALALSLEGSATPDPNPTSCGFAAESEATIYHMDVPEAVVNQLPFAP